MLLGLLVGLTYTDRGTLFPPLDFDNLSPSAMKRRQRRFEGWRICTIITVPDPFRTRSSKIHDGSAFGRISAQQ